MGGERRGKGEREGRKGTEEGPTKNSCRGAQNVKLHHWTIPTVAVYVLVYIILQYIFFSCIIYMQLP